MDVIQQSYRGMSSVSVICVDVFTTHRMKSKLKWRDQKEVPYPADAEEENQINISTKRHLNLSIKYFWWPKLDKVSVDKT